MKDIIKENIDSHIQLIEKIDSTLRNQIVEAAKLALDCINKGNKIILFGNGGSAADSQHIAAELTGRFKIDRRALPAIALTTDTSALTAIANDFGYQTIFRRQVEALSVPGDLLIGISTSGNSENVFNAIEFGLGRGCEVIALTGKNGGRLNNLAILNIIIPSDDTARIQEMHILIGHIICNIIEKNIVIHES